MAILYGHSLLIVVLVFLVLLVFFWPTALCASQ